MRGDGAAKFQFELDLSSGVPVYRQIMDQVQAAIAAGTLAPADQLPTVRQLAVDLSVNPNTVIRAYREMEIRGILTTQQGSGTFVSKQKVSHDQVERERRLTQLVTDFAARAGAGGFTLREALDHMRSLYAGSFEE